MRRLSGLAIVLVGVAIAASAFAVPVFPSLVSGEYVFRVRAGPVEVDAAGVPLGAPTRSVGIRVLGDPAVLACTPAQPGEVVEISVTVTASGDRAEMRGYGWSEVGCTGIESGPSENGAYVFFTPPAPPLLEPSGP